MSKPVHGSKSSYKGVKRGYAKLSQIISEERTNAMPIYEFRCLKCSEVFEILMVSTKDDVDMRCPHCKSEDFERVLSTTSYAMGFTKGESRGPKVRSRECASGTCSTIDLPGHSKN